MNLALRAWRKLNIDRCATSSRADLDLPLREEGSVTSRVPVAGEPALAAVAATRAWEGASEMLAHQLADVAEATVEKGAGEGAPLTPVSAQAPSKQPSARVPVCKCMQFSSSRASARRLFGDAPALLPGRPVLHKVFFGPRLGGAHVSQRLP